MLEQRRHAQRSQWRCRFFPRGDFEERRGAPGSRGRPSHNKTPRAPFPVGLFSEETPPLGGTKDGRRMRRAVDTAWTVYLATHRGVDIADGPRCLLERQQQRRLVSGETEVLTCSGLAISIGFPKTNG